MRIGYFGGTFDPPHRAHLLAAQAAADAMRLDRVFLAPTGLQPLKAAGPHASYDDRLAMTRLLCAEDPRMEVSEIDAPHPDGSPNYTIDALARLRSRFPDAELFVIVGADTFLSLPRWREPEKLLAEAEWIVLSRPGFELNDIDPDHGGEGIASLNLTPEQRARVHLVETLDEDISASGIRERLRVGVSCGKSLTPTVGLYIARMHLYHAT
ncbi:nicotinate (nicotinamide) nucleotide adenylyltransferase [Terriglobus roseus]|uniref:Probable nicotinate-nucleotide adenylyltransferase n=1 Tax=Terriglobus roseus TaxID=392734 RepID=A0A1H4MSD7_9BACT|nr:nicotinate (nicotinamide) nucleotide adenylyltransferase [Terriglobus roseus]SEB85863.1 nicotinate-nucleotide adenylyltransferase [Terriglobus roseus]